MEKEVGSESNSNIIKINYDYPKDLVEAGIEVAKMQRLIDENRIAKPIKTETYKNTEKVASTITKYDEFDNLLLPKEEFGIKGIGAIESFSPEDRKITYDRYDEDGNLQQYTLENGTPVSIIWGYNGQYPIAKIEGVGYDQISSTLRNNAITASNADTSHCTGYGGCNEATLRVRLKALRNGLSSALVTTYTYDPLIGVTSITPPNGQTAYYKYDGFGRLESVEDEEGNKVQDIQYHYRTP